MYKLVSKNFETLNVFRESPNFAPQIIDSLGITKCMPLSIHGLHNIQFIHPSQFSTIRVQY